MASRMATYFVPGAGIDREVITTDICRYLGPDALVKPGQYADPKRGPNAQPEPGYFVTAYRSLTTDQLTDIKADSARWIAERSRNQQNNRQTGGGISPMREMEKSRQSNMTPDRYAASATRARQDQPSPYAPMPPYGQPPVQQPTPQRYDQYESLISQPPQQSQYQQDYSQASQSYGYAQPGQATAYAVIPNTGRTQTQPQGYSQPPVGGYTSQGRGIEAQYGGMPDLRQQSYSSSYGNSLGRSQPMAPQQQYPTSGQPLDAYAYQRGQPGQQEDTTMGDDYEYADTGSPALYSSTPAQTQPPTSSRHRSERERDRDRSDRDRDEPSRRSKHSRR